jgi:uncharacterized membrane protein
MDNYAFYLTFLAAVSSGMVAGVLFAFSAFVMKALMRIQAAQGIAAMQSINITVQSLLCSLLFFGTGLISLFLLILSLLRWEEPGAIYLLAGSLCYLFGGLLVTGAFNVPLNNKLAAVQPDHADGQKFWRTFTADWLPWNHVRTVACILTSVSYTAALLSF